MQRFDTGLHLYLQKSNKNCMMKGIDVLLFVCCVFAGFACNQEHPGLPELPEARPIELRSGLEQRIVQDNTFAFRLFRMNLQEEKEKQNLLISPLSVSIALGMTWNGADGDTKKEMEEVLEMSGMSVDDINEYYQTVQEALLNVDPSTKLRIANSIWYKQNFPVKPEFLTINQNYFKAEARALDFSNPSAVKTINDWCAEKTDQLIPEIIDRIENDVVMYLINAVYFKGIWANRFEKNDTYTGDFTAETGEKIEVDMMNQTFTFGYASDENAAYLDMPYGNKAFSMTVILPHEGKSLSGAADALTGEFWNEITGNMYPRNVNVHLPRFKFKYDIEMQQILKNMGMQESFTSAADFSGIAPDVRISRVLHKTFVETNEEGTEAAAVTAVEMEFTVSAEPSVIPFVANRPFMFVIREKSTGIILFVGKVGKCVVEQ
jgi:serpin B